MESFPEILNQLEDVEDRLEKKMQSTVWASEKSDAVNRPRNDHDESEHTSSQHYRHLQRTSDLYVSHYVGVRDLSRNLYFQ